MDQVYPDDGLVQMLKIIVNNKFNGLVWFLYVNDVTPTRDSQIGDFTLVGADWGEHSLTDTDFVFTQVTNHVGLIQANNIVFTNDSGDPVDVYGYVISNVADGIIVAAARFDDAPRTIEDGGTTVVIPILGDFSEATGE